MKDERLAEISGLQQGLRSAWPTLSRYLTDRKNELILSLVASNNEETRGRIKELASLLDLPSALHDEALHLQQPQQESELP